MRISKIISYIMRYLPEIHIIPAFTGQFSLLFTKNQLIHHLFHIRKRPIDFMFLIYKRWFAIRQDAANIKRQSMFLKFFILCILCNITCQQNMLFFSHLLPPVYHLHLTHYFCFIYASITLYFLSSHLQ